MEAKPQDEEEEEQEPSNDFFTVDEPADEAPPAPEGDTPAPPEAKADQPAPEATTPPAPAEAPKPEEDATPSWLKEIPEADRAGVVNRMLEGLSPEERAKLPAVSPLLEGTAAAAARRGRESAVVESATENAETRIASVRERLSPLLAGHDLDADLNEVQEAAREQIGAHLSNGLMNVLGSMHVTELPQDVLERAAAADNYGQSFQIYASYIRDKAYSDGVAQGKTQNDVAGKADLSIEKARWRDEHLAELAKSGRLRDETPPAIATGTTVGEEVPVSEEEWAEAMRDQDKFDRLWDDPRKRAYINKALVEA